MSWLVAILVSNDYVYVCFSLSFVRDFLRERTRSYYVRSVIYRMKWTLEKIREKKNIPYINKSFFFFFLAFTLVFYILRITLTSCGFCTRVYNFFFFLFYFFFSPHNIYICIWVLFFVASFALFFYSLP